MRSCTSSTKHMCKFKEAMGLLHMVGKQTVGKQTVQMHRTHHSCTLVTGLNNCAGTEPVQLAEPTDTAC